MKQPHEITIRTAIGASPRWNGTANVESWPCGLCGSSFDTADEIRAHFDNKHPSVEVTAEYGTDDPGYQAALDYVESLDPAATAGWRSV